MRRALVILLCGLGLICGLGPAAPGDALAAGAPVSSIVGGAGVSVAGSPVTFIALPAGGSTLVERVRRRGGALDGYAMLSGAFGVPGAANDGSATGLSADARTLVLAGIASSFPPTRTRLVVLDAGPLRIRARIALPGYYSVDAISPTGRWLYLIHYKSPPAGYEVRAYDLATRHLLARPVVDPREPDEKMQGLPVTRTMGPGGRWAYTLYQRIDGGSPFIHALDTATLRAFCVDLPIPGSVDLSSTRLVLGTGTTLRVETDGAPVALMDTRTLAVRSPEAARAPARRHASSARAGGGLSWALVIGPLVALAVVVLLARRRRRSVLAGPPPATSP
jgi:hypothetical protein